MLDLGRMRIMTIGAANALVKHLALRKRAKLINLFHDLPVGMVEMVVQQFIHVVIVEVLARTKSRLNNAPQGMTGRAGLYFHTRVLWILESWQRVATLSIPKQGLRCRQLDMQTAWTVTGLTIDVMSVKEVR
jgi:hypothetical protein